MKPWPGLWIPADHLFDPPVEFGEFFRKARLVEGSLPGRHKGFDPDEMPPSGGSSDEAGYDGCPAEGGNLEGTTRRVRRLLEERDAKPFRGIVLIHQNADNGPALQPLVDGCSSVRASIDDFQPVPAPEALKHSVEPGITQRSGDDHARRIEACQFHRHQLPIADVSGQAEDTTTMRERRVKVCHSLDVDLIRMFRPPEGMPGEFRDVSAKGGEHVVGQKICLPWWKVERKAEVRDGPLSIPPGTPKGEPSSDAPEHHGERTRENGEREEHGGDEPGKEEILEAMFQMLDTGRGRPPKRAKHIESLVKRRRLGLLAFRGCRLR